MLKVSGKVTLVKVSLNDFKRQFKKEMTDNLKKTVKSWLMATSGRVPIWSGMALGSLLEVSETIGGGLLITPRTNIKSRISLGKSMGSLDAIYGPNEYSMIMKSKVPHYVLQEHVDVGVSKSAPWRSFEAGMSAAKLTAQNISVQFPTIKKKVISL
jgi:hypothetical protein